MNVLINSISKLAISWGYCEFSPGPEEEVIVTEQCLCSKCIWQWNPSTEEFENIGDCDSTRKNIVLQDLIDQSHKQIVFEDGILKTGNEGSSVNHGMRLERFSKALLDVDEEWLIEHGSDPTFKRLIQVYNEKFLTDKSLDFDAADESNFIQEDVFKTSFEGDSLHLQGFASGPYGHWHLNESSGVNVADSSGNGRDGTAIGIEDSDWVPGKLNNCLNLENNEYVDLGGIANFERDESFSVECWVKTSEATAGLMTKYNGTLGWALYFEASTLFFMLVHEASTADRIRRRAAVSINDGFWHHIIATYDGSETLAGTHIYVDGVLQDSATGNTDNLTGSIVGGGPCYLAALHNWLAYRLDGEIDECAIYDYKLTQADVTFRWNEGAGTEISGYSVGGWYVLTEAAQINTSSWASLVSMLFSQVTPVDTQLRYLLSVDGRITWKKWDGDSWETEALANIHTNGNTKAELEALNEESWDLIFSPGTLDFAIGLKTADEKFTPNLDAIDLGFYVPGKYKCRETELDMILVSEVSTRIVNVSGAELNNLGAIILT